MTSDISLEAQDRRKLAKTAEPKESKFPRTSRRQARIQAVLARRQPDLAIVLENVHDPHNVSAVLRSCDAVGAMTLYGVYTSEQAPESFARTTSGSGAKWVDVRMFESIDQCYSALRAVGFSIGATALRTDSVDLYDVDFTKPTALVFGNEMEGVSIEALAQADFAVSIPMQGMVESLNISVACAVTLFEAMRQRRLAGQYSEPKLQAEQLALLAEEWLQR